MTPSDPSGSAPQGESGGGFGHSRRRVLTEVGVLIGAVVALAAGAIWLAGALSGWLLPFISTDLDVTLGKQAWSSPELSLRRCENPGPLRYVERISKPLLQALGPTPYEFQFQVVDDEQVNAFALPGGFITVNMGLLEKAESGEEVAAVIGHELQHVTHRHGTRRMVRRMGGYMVLSLIFGGTGIEYPAYLVGELTGLSYDRGEESEADAGGLQLMQKAGINPLGMKSFFARLDEESGPTPPALVSTHPDPGDRAARAERAASEGGPYPALPAPGDLVCSPK